MNDKWHVLRLLYNQAARIKLFLRRSTTKLFEERISIFGNRTTYLGYVPNRAWIGDQALMLTCFRDLSTALAAIAASRNPLALSVPAITTKEIDDIIAALRRGVMELMVSKDRRRMIVDFVSATSDTFPFGNLSDYATGLAIYLRMLTDGDEHNYSADEIATLAANGTLALTHLKTVTNIESFNDAVSRLAKATAWLLSMQRDGMNT